jgi:hypothetical protein
MKYQFLFYPKILFQYKSIILFLNSIGMFDPVFISIQIFNNSPDQAKYELIPLF